MADDLTNISIASQTRSLGFGETRIYVILTEADTYRYLDVTLVAPLSRSLLANALRELAARIERND